MNIIGDKLNKYDDYSKINEDIRNNFFEEESSDETTIDNEIPQTENEGTGLNRLNMSFDG